jgi:TetR/AcrR family transcriptional regulator
MPGPRGASRRRSADERRELVIDAARDEFAVFGLSGATGESISYRAGISHPYLLRLFGSKRELFLGVVARTFDELEEAVGDAPASGAAPSLIGLEGALSARLERAGGHALLVQFCAACGNDEVRVVVRRRFAQLFELLARASGDEPGVSELFARVMLQAAAEAMRLPDVAGRDVWARRLLDHATAG